MAAPEGKVPVLESAAQGVRFLREQWRPALIIAAVSAGATVLLSLLAAVLGPLAILLAQVVQACAYAALLHLALTGAAPGARAIAVDGGRVLAAMAVIGFFLFIVCVVAALPSVVIASFGFVGFEDRAKALGADAPPEEAMRLLTDALAANPFPFLLVLFGYIAIWLLLTSRLYLAAPATVANRAVQTFETWSWTKGNMLRILAARIVLMAPATILVLAVWRFAGAPFGFNTFEPASWPQFAAANPIGFVFWQFVSEVAQNFALLTLDAGLSAYLFLGLRGEAAKPPQP